MTGHYVAILLAGTVLALALIGPIVFVFYWLHIGKIRRSPSATRAEKNWRHLTTVLTVAITAAIGVATLLFDRTTGVILLLFAAFLLAFVVPLRTMFVELGLRRVSSKTQGNHR